VNRPLRLIDRFIGVGRRAGIGIGDCDPSECTPADHVRALLRGEGWVAECVVGIGIAVRPAIDGEREDIAGWIEAART